MTPDSRLTAVLDASAKRALNRRDVQSALRHFVFPAIAGGLDAAQQIVMPIVDAWMNMQPVVFPDLKQTAGIVLHAAVIAGGAAGMRFVHRWLIDLKEKVGFDKS